MTTDPNQIVRCGNYDFDTATMDRSNGGHLWPYKSSHYDGYSSIVPPTLLQPVGDGIPAAKRGRRWYQQGCCTACQMGCCCCVFPMIDCIHGADLTGAITVSISFITTGWETMGAGIPEAIIEAVKKLTKRWRVTWYCRAGLTPKSAYWDLCGFDAQSLSGAMGGPEPMPIIYTQGVIATAQCGVSSIYPEGDGKCNFVFDYPMCWTEHVAIGELYDVYVYINSGTNYGVAYDEIVDCDDKHAAASATSTYGTVTYSVRYKSGEEHTGNTLYINTTFSHEINWPYVQSPKMPPTTITCYLSKETKPCDPNDRKIAAAIKAARDYGPVKAAIYNTCQFKSALRPVNGYPGTYWYYAVTPNRSNVFAWTEDPVTCSSRWGASFNVIDVGVKQALRDENDPSKGYEVCCLETYTTVISNGDVDSDYAGQYDCGTMPDFIPNTAISYKTDPKTGKQVPCCSCQVGDHTCEKCSCCHPGWDTGGLGGGVYLGETFINQGLRNGTL